jgi:GT2 family glycosyltransferase
MTSIELVISANGCTDNTKAYTDYLLTVFPHITIIWNEKPLGFAKACNAGIEQSLRHNTKKIVLLNNDTLLLEQPKNQWLYRLDDYHADISSVLTLPSKIINQKFAVFFCTMINKKVFETIGLLDESFETGGCEDIDFCFRADKNGFNLVDVGFKGDFPIYHAAEGTVHNPELVSDWKDKFHENELKLAKKYNMDHYRYLLSNNYERAVFLKGDAVFPRETQRYNWARQNLRGTNILEIGCSTGYGCQFLPDNYTYMGIDYDPIIIQVAKEQEWRANCEFVNVNINKIGIDHYDTIIAFEVIEHLDNGLDVVKKLQNHCKRLLITVPHNEPKGFWGEHHKLHGLTEKDFPNFQFSYINHAGEISDVMQPITPENPSNLMICRWDNE